MGIFEQKSFIVYSKTQNCISVLNLHSFALPLRLINRKLCN